MFASRQLKCTRCGCQANGAQLPSGLSTSCFYVVIGLNTVCKSPGCCFVSVGPAPTCISYHSDLGASLDFLSQSARCGISVPVSVRVPQWWSLRAQSRILTSVGPQQCA